MKKILFSWFVGMLYVSANAQTSENLSGTFTEGAHEICKPGAVVVSPTPQDSFSVSGNASFIIKSATEIRLLPGFHAGGFTNGGSFHASISPQCNVVDFIWLQDTIYVGDTISFVNTSSRFDNSQSFTWYFQLMDDYIETALTNDTVVAILTDTLKRVFNHSGNYEINVETLNGDSMISKSKTIEVMRSSTSSNCEVFVDETDCNLVSNYGFECYTVLPFQLDNIEHAYPWEKIQSSDLYNTASTSPLVGIPQNNMGYQNGFNNSNGYAGLITYAVERDYPIYENYREYIKTELESELEIGQKYFVSFSASLADNVQRAVRVGLYLTDDNLDPGTDINSEITGIPNGNSFLLESSSIITDENNWTTISGYFTPQVAGIKYLFVGRFNDVGENDKIAVEGLDDIYYIGSSYYFIDNVIVSEYLPPEIISPVEACVNSTVSFSYETEFEGNFTASWDFGDGSYSSDNEPTHSYQEPGIYIAHLHLSTECITYDVCKKIQITPSTSDYNTSCCSNSFFIYHQSDITTDVSLPVNSTVNWTSNRKVKSTVKIPYGTTLNISQCTIEFGPWGKLIVERGGNLVLGENAILTGLNYCGTMWQGIEVWGKSDESQNSINQGKITLNNRSTIMRAHNAVLLGRFKTYECAVPTTLPYDLAYSGGIIIADGAAFRDNALAVRFAPYNKLESQSIIKNCTFTAKDVLDPGYHTGNSYTYWNTRNPYYMQHNNEQESYAHIYMWGVRYLRLWNNQFLLGENGIISIDSKFFAEKGITASGNLFNGLTSKGIWGLYTGTSAFYGNRIKQNRFQETPFGVHILGGKSDVFEENLFNENFTTTQSFVGIGMQNSRNFRIQNNNRITGYFAGVVVDNSLNTGGYVGSNSSGVANTFDQCRTSVWANHENEYLKIRCNDFLNNTLAYYLRNWYVAYTIGDQGEFTTSDNKKPAGNKFFPHNIDPRKYIRSDYETFYYYRHNFDESGFESVKPIAEPGSIQPQSDIINTLVNKTSTSCSVTNVLGRKSLLDNHNNDLYQLKSDLDSVTGILDGQETSKTINAIKDGTITADSLKNLLLERSPLSNSVLSALIDTIDYLSENSFAEVIITNTPFSKIIRNKLYPLLDSLPAILADSIIKQQATSARITPTGIERKINTVFTERQIIMGELIEQLIDNDSIDFAFAELEADSFYLSKRESMESLVGAYIFDSLLTDAQNLLNEYMPIATTDAAWKELMQLKIDLATNNLTEFDIDSTQEATIRNFADNLESSLAKAHACAWLSLVYHEECELVLTEPSGKTDETIPNTSQNQTNNETDWYFRMYPNPATDKVIFEYSLKEEEKGNLEFYNVKGQLLTAYSLKTNYNEFAVNISSLIDGVYIVKVVVNEETRYTDRLVIIR